MPLATYVPISTYTTTSTSENSIAISGIPQNYKHLVISFQGGRSDNNLTNIYTRFNDDSSSAYNSITMAWQNGATGVYNKTLGTSWGFLYTNQETANAKADLMDYTNTNKYKTMLTMNGSSAINASITVNTWRNTAAVTKITFFTATAAGFTVGTRLTLWGIN